MNFSNMQKVFDIFNNTQAVIVELGDYDDYENTYTIKELGSVEGDLQPYSGGLAEKEYGLSIDCQYQFYCSNNSNIKIGAYVVVGTQKYEIVYVATWDLGMAVLLKEVELYGGRKQNSEGNT